MKILISTPMLGGVGGVERAVASWIDVLSDHEVYVCPASVHRSGFRVDRRRVRVLHRLRFVRSRNRRQRAQRQFLRRLPQPGPFDLYIEYRGGPQLLGQIETRVSVFCPAGKDARERGTGFDWIMSETPSGSALIDDPAREALIPPPVWPTAWWSEPVPGVPADFLLTVFNPHDPNVKGVDDLYVAADESALPIVWCTDSTTSDHGAHIRDHPNIIVIRNLRQPQLRWLYERCTSYVCFSRTEGFGWAIADAMLFGSPIVSRRLGVLTLVEDLPGVRIFETRSELLQALAAAKPGTFVRDVSILGPERARRSLLALAGVEPPAGEGGVLAASRRSNHRDAERFAVIIPARNAAVTLGAQLDALLGQNWPIEGEVIVADNGSTDETRSIVASSIDDRLRLVDASSRTGPAHARNVGVAATDASLLLFCDADDVVGESWIGDMVDGLGSAPAVAGVHELDQLNPSWLTDALGRYLERRLEFEGTFTFASSSNLAIRRSVFESLGGFDEAIQAGEDIDLSYRLRSYGHEMMFEPNAVVHYRLRRDAGQRWRQAFAYGRFPPTMYARLRREGVRTLPSRWAGLRYWAWLIVRIPLLSDVSGRTRWMWVAAQRLGRLRGSIDARSLWT